MPVAYNAQTGEGVFLGADNTWQKAPVAKHADGNVVIYNGKEWEAAKTAQPTQPAAPTKNPPSTALDVARGAGSGLAEGIADIVPGIVDLGAKTGTYLGNKTGRAIQGQSYIDQPYMPSLTAALNKALHIDYDPRTTLGKYAKTTSSFIPAALAAQPSSISKGIAQAVRSGALSETAGQLTEGTPLEPYARLVAGILPTSVVIPGAQTLTRAVMRGDALPQEIEQNASKFEKAGTTASIGQATEGGIPRAIESLLSKLPGSANTMKQFAEKQQADIGAGLEKTASKIAPASTSAAAGRAIQEDINEGFKPAIQNTQRKLYETLDKHMPPNTLVDVSNTKSMLNELTSPVSNAKNLSQNKVLQSQGMESIKSDFEKDMAGQPGTPKTSSAILDQSGEPIEKPGTPGIPPRKTMPYEVLKDLRTKINAKIQQFNLEPDVQKADLKRLASALTKDMKNAVQKQGPEAVKAFEKANAYTSQLHEDLQELENVVNQHGGERVFDAVLKGSNKGDTTVRTVMKALSEKTKGLFSSAVLRRMGKANPSNQNDIGDVFSTEKFLTNWNQMSPGAKSALFDGYGAGFSHDMDRIAKVASNIREGSKFFKNPSGTAPAETALQAANNLGAEVLSKLMIHKNAAQWFTNPATVKWLAKATTMPKSAAPAAIASLNNLIKGKDDPTTKRTSSIPPSPTKYPPIPQTINIK